ncbi:trypsin-like peptidase domain-containing protein [Kibdelosporangium philippinense]|uniref:Trypsin-like peptidase domain-containing protein n=1 Tax=Kibdelosporangium philippinense TaxID=211113 RepID=A0ABS8ZPX8_9PSEU|nr:trypsin-like peptidase domain-containing protein [Kibdelosporangium philippinense]MCE7009770.1 trypsin-like peptidase domain-containing protein [Kibdelosporangium philippinense]
MTQTQKPQQQYPYYGPAQYPASTPPPAYGGGLPPTGGPVPPALAGPGKPRRFSKGAVSLSIAAVVAAGLVGGVTGSLIGGNDSGSLLPTSTSISQSVGNNTPTDVSAIASKVLPSVVQVNVQTAQEQGIGSGVILTADGQVLTNNHVVAGGSRATVTVTLNDGRTVPARVVGTDAASDLAVLQLQGVSGLPPATLGDSSQVKIGDAVVAIGSPGGLQGTVTTGIVSALNRPVNISDNEGGNPFASTSNESTQYKAIQTDASINQGNSGGPLVNSNGEIIGINSAIYSPVSTPDGRAGSVGIGFSIPINDAKTVVNQILGR